MVIAYSSLFVTLRWEKEGSWICFLQMPLPQWYELGNFPALLILWLYSFTFSLNLPHWIHATSVISSEIASIQNSFLFSILFRWNCVRIDKKFFARLAVQGACFLIWIGCFILFLRGGKSLILERNIRNRQHSFSKFSMNMAFFFLWGLYPYCFTKQKEKQGTTSPTQAVFFNVILWCVWYANISYIEDLWSMIWIKLIIFWRYQSSTGTTSKCIDYLSGWHHFKRL